jgi:DnaK suppressor protein
MAKKKGGKMKKRFVKKDLDAYKDILLDLKDDVLNQIREISEDALMKSQKDMSGDISGYTIHMADVATDSYERDFNLGLVSNERKIIFEIDDALKRIEDKKYGVCECCKKNIAIKRLKAIPYAKNCKKCQEKLEKEERTH